MNMHSFFRHLFEYIEYIIFIECIRASFQDLPVNHVGKAPVEALYLIRLFIGQSCQLTCMIYTSIYIIVMI